MEHGVGTVVTRLRLVRRSSAGWWNVASASSRRGPTWYDVGQPVTGRISESASSTRAHLVHRGEGGLEKLAQKLLGNHVVCWRTVVADAKLTVETIKIETTTTTTILSLSLILPLLHLPLSILLPILRLRHLFLHLLLAGSDAIPAEVYKHGGPQLMGHLTALFQEMWRQGEVPQDFKDATIVHLYKRKGNRQLCDNHRGISLLNIAGKVLPHILLNRLNDHLEQGLLLESQCCFRRHRGTTDMIFVARQLQEKCQEMRTHLWSTFVDLTKAFDTVNCEGLWKIMQKFGCPERFIEMVRQLHDGMMARVTDNGTVSEAFAVTNGVKQGCVLAPTLFSLMFSAMLMDAYHDERPPGSASPTRRTVTF
ncbi:hypothetical protein SprV_0802526900 [Sparganum proliferum]